MSEAALEITGLSKSFGGVRALESVDLRVAPGEIHGLVGRNGSGKSTLIKVLAGYHSPDPGAQLKVAGREVPLPVHARALSQLGLSFVHQDLGLVANLSILENMRVGRYRSRFAWNIDWRMERRAVAGALARFEVGAPLDAPISSLSALDRALVAIARAFTDAGANERGVIILDEPTAYLPADGVERLFSALRQLAHSGTAIVLVSHRLEEMFQLTERVTVLRDGNLIATTATSELDEDRLVELILGHAVESVGHENLPRLGEVTLSVRKLSGGSVSDVNFDVHRGEILGLAGLIGMGQAEVPYLLYGECPARAGTVQLRGEDVAVTSLHPRRATQLGIVLLPADRLGKSGIGPLSIRENVSLPVLRNFFERGRLRRGREVAYVSRLLSDYGVRPPLPDNQLATLSGGNQQKALLGKWLRTEPAVMLLDEPSQGVDIGARQEIFQRLRRAAGAGGAFVMSSSDLGDLAGVCDRVLVFRYGRIVGELSGAALEEDRLTELVYSSRKVA